MQWLLATAASGFAAPPPADCFAATGVPAIDIGREEEQLQKQAGVELDLEEDDRKQRDVYQPERIVTDLLKAGQPDTE